MEIKMKMPDLATTDSAIKVVRWLVTPGQPVQRGQVLLEVETDKATMEVECIATGIFKQPLAQPGDTLLAGQALAAIEVEAPSRPAPTPAAPAPEAAPAASPSVGSAKGGLSDATPSPVVAPPAKAAGGMFAKNRAAANRPNPS